MIVEEQKHSKNFKNRKFYQDLAEIQYIKILKTILMSQEKPASGWPRQ